MIINKTIRNQIQKRHRWHVAFTPILILFLFWFLFFSGVSGNNNLLNKVNISLFAVFLYCLCLSISIYGQSFFSFSVVSGVVSPILCMFTLKKTPIATSISMWCQQAHWDSGFGSLGSDDKSVPNRSPLIPQTPHTVSFTVLKTGTVSVSLPSVVLKHLIGNSGLTCPGRITTDSIL